MKTEITNYEAQAQAFLDRFQIRFRATLSDSRVAPWHQPGQNECDTVRRQGGHHYRVTLSKSTGAGKRGHVHRYNPVTGGCRCGDVWEPGKPSGLEGKPNRLTFDFFGSVAACEAGIATVTPYDVLACISSDTHCADTFKDFCADFGESEDSIRALQTWRRCSAFSKRLRGFFTSEEIEALREIA